ncbi:TolC family protein, partial [Rubrivirga sp.]|uniref:TolC family protein n=1 Tax=Rubrivirga sp. TaxID=1885344 RepID=UPI003C732668
MRTLLVLLLLAPGLHAQTVVDLEDALRMARTEAIAVQRAGVDVQSAQIAIDAIEDGRLPSLSLDAGGGQRYGLSFDQTSGDLTQATVESLDLGVRASYVVFDGFERRAATNAATALLRSAELDQARAEQVTGVAVLDGYFAVAQADAAEAIALENVEAQRDLLAEIEVQAEYGERPQYEVSQQQERVAAAQANVLT